MIDHDHQRGCGCTPCRFAVLAEQEYFDRLTADDLPGVLDHQHVWDEVGDGCWDCLLGLRRAGVPVYHVPDFATDVARVFPREMLMGLVLEVRTVDTKRVGYLRLARDGEERPALADLPPHFYEQLEARLFGAETEVPA